jgi:hypothetical protein
MDPKRLGGGVDMRIGSVFCGLDVLCKLRVVRVSRGFGLPRCRQLHGAFSTAPLGDTA